MQQSSEFHEYLKNIGTSESYQNQNLKQLVGYAVFLGKRVTFYQVRKKEQIVSFLDTKIKNIDIDPEKV